MEVLYWLIVAILLPSTVFGDYTVRVNSTTGEDTPDCLKSTSDNPPCATLDYVSTVLPFYTSTSVQIKIEGDYLHLESTAEFVSFTNLTLTAVSSRSAIVCSGLSNAGLKFVRVCGLMISNLDISHCGSVQDSTTTNHTAMNKTAKIKTAMYILNSTDITLTNVNVYNSAGMGVTLFDTNGTVHFFNSNFSGNRIPTPENDTCLGYPGGNGVYVEFSSCTPGIYGNCLRAPGENNNSLYTFEKCYFTDNNASTLPCVSKTERYNNPGNSDYQGLGHGGGLIISIRSTASSNDFTVSHCTFARNWAGWSGGISIILLDYPQNNRVTIVDSVFEKNNCSVGPGGGGSVGFLFVSEGLTPLRAQQSQGNSVTFKNCLFRSNEAPPYGGGLSLYASRSLHYAARRNTMEFNDCTFKGQRSHTSSAVDIGPSAWSILDNGLLPVPVFIDCTFVSNTLREWSREYNGSTLSIGGVGTFGVSSFCVEFQGNTNFTNNTGTALYLTSGIANFSNGSTVTFQNNTGVNGGAISMIAFSVVLLNANSQIQFLTNRAHSKGGAIFVMSSDQHIHLSSRSCFIQYPLARTSANKDPENVTIQFKGNEATNGTSIYASSLHACFTACGYDYPWTNVTFHEAFRCVGLFYFNDTGEDLSVMTIPQNYTKSNNHTVRVTPGKPQQLPIRAYDELSQLSGNVVYRTFLASNFNINIDPSYMYIADNHINLLGSPGKGDLTLEQPQYRASITFPVEVTECPPGFRLDDSGGKGECVCADSTLWGITGCDSGTFRVNISHGFWTGLCRNDQKEALCTSNCPIGFCSYDNSSSTGIQHRLPAKVSELDAFICGPKRTGTLCGRCSAGYSVYYTSFTYTCGRNSHCHIGWLFYILLELLPVTLLFLTILIFDITFTSGATTGFILFAQVVDSLSFDANGIIQFPKAVSTLLIIPRFFYRLLDLNPFSVIDDLSFCIWEGATFLNVMMMRYATTAYALGLVLCAVFVMNTLRCRKLCARFSSRSLKSTIIHGLSTFFIICYGQCARVTILILTTACLQGENLECVRKVVFRSGELPAFGREHLYYAIPAFLVLITFVMIPPLMLIAFPLLFKLLALCKLSETRFVNWLSRIVPLQLLDSFQSCFRDNFRFFSGLYFFYRTFIALITFAISNTLDQFYLFVGIQIGLILALHAVTQPYKERWHNILDALIFTTIATINGLTTLNYQMSTAGKERQKRVKDVVAITSTFQFLLVSWPLVYMIAYVVVKIVRKARKWHAARKKHQRTMSNVAFEDSTRLPDLRDHSGIFFSGQTYLSLKD